MSVPGVLLGALDADLLFRSEGLEKSRMTLNGCYRPPLGRLGAGLDRAVLHRVAEATIRALLRGIADTLTEPKQASTRYQNATGSTALRLMARGTDALRYAADAHRITAYGIANGGISP